MLFPLFYVHHGGPPSADWAGLQLS